VWRTWIAAIAASTDADVVPGERTSGIGRFLGGVAAGAVTYDVPPLLEAPRPDGSMTFVADAQATFDLFEERVPFPAAARIGGRVRVSVLDGVGAEGLAAAAGRDVVRAGGQVVVVGNADRFDSVGTRVVYFDGALADRVEAFAEQLGVEAELSTDPNPDDRIDAIVVVGSEAAAAYGLPLRSTTNGDDAG
jgi:LytR cell envelope-related transcriptional attenuator